MSENERTATELACSLGTIRCPNRVALARDIESSLAAAEERGRRSGVEECIGVVRLVPTLARIELADSLRMFLAPRDSAPCNAVCATTHICWHGREHLPAEAPPNSGKEG